MKKLVIATALVALVASQGFAATRTGLAAIGFAGWATQDRQIAAESFAAVGGDLEMAWLYACFTPPGQDPMQPADEFLKSVVPRIRGRLFLTVYLDNGPTRRKKASGQVSYGPPFRPDLSPAEFWRFAGGSSSDRKVKQFYADWRSFIQPYAVWAKSITKWAKDRSLDDKLVLIVVPVLEDNAGRDTRAYSALLHATDDTVSGLPINWRRNGDARIDGIRYEIHGLSGSALSGNDVLTNDGSPTTASNWMKIQKPLVRRGVTCLWWAEAFNGSSRSVVQWKRAPIRPFTGNGNVEAKIKELLAILGTR